MENKISLKKISGSLKFIIIAMGLCALALQSVASLMFIISEADDIEKYRLPWMCLIWATAIPMIPALYYSWRTAVNIGKNKAFCTDNAKNLKNIAISSAADTVLVLLGNIIFIAIGISHPSVFLFCMVIELIGLAIFIAALGLSQLIVKAAELQEENDLTI